MKPSNEQLLDDLISAASDNNEFDNRSELEYLRGEVLRRMKRIEKKNWHCPECSTGFLQETAFEEEGKTVKVIACNRCRYNRVEKEK